MCSVGAARDLAVPTRVCVFTDKPRVMRGGGGRSRPFSTLLHVLHMCGAMQNVVSASPPRNRWLGSAVSRHAPLVAPSSRSTLLTRLLPSHAHLQTIRTRKATTSGPRHARRPKSAPTRSAGTHRIELLASTENQARSGRLQDGQGYWKGCFRRGALRR